MTRSQIRQLISEKTRWYGRGFSYDCYINGNHVGGSQALRKQAEKGDKIRVEVFKNRFVAGRIRFQVEEEEITGSRSNTKNNIHPRPRDSQKSKLYTWEKLDVFRDGWRKNQVESEQEAEEFVKGICTEFGFSAPSVRHNSGRKKCAYFPREDEIRIGGWGEFSKEILVHETAHAVLEKLSLNKLIASHGPAFTTLFMKMLSKILGYSIEEMKKKADRRNLDYLEDFDAEKWKNKDELSVKEIGKLREETYHTKRGETFTQAQLQAIQDIRNGNRPDGRSMKALKNRGYAEKQNGEKWQIQNEEKLLI